MAKLTPNQIDQIVSHAEAGKHAGWVSRAMTIPESTVVYQFLINGHDPWVMQKRARAKNGFSEEQDASMLQRRTAGESKLSIARSMKRNYNSVRIRILTLEVRAENATVSLPVAERIKQPTSNRPGAVGILTNARCGFDSCLGGHCS